MSIQVRIQKIIDELYSKNKRAFSLAIGVNPSVIENIVGKRQGNPSFEITQKIITANENINADWLMTGRGEMINNSSSMQTGSNNISNTGRVFGQIQQDSSINNSQANKGDYQGSNEIQYLKNIIEQKDAIIRAKDEIIEILKNQISRNN